MLLLGLGFASVVVWFLLRFRASCRAVSCDSFMVIDACLVIVRLVDCCGTWSSKAPRRSGLHARSSPPRPPEAGREIALLLGQRDCPLRDPHVGRPRSRRRHPVQRRCPLGASHSRSPMSHRWSFRTSVAKDSSITARTKGSYATVQPSCPGSSAARRKSRSCQGAPLSFQALKGASCRSRFTWLGRSSQGTGS